MQQKFICDEPIREDAVREVNDASAGVEIQTRNALTLVNERFPNLNKSQRAAVFMSLSHRIALSQGPLGTGKSHTASIILKVNQDLFGKVLAAAPSNDAVDVIAR